MSFLVYLTFLSLGNVCSLVVQKAKIHNGLTAHILFINMQESRDRCNCVTGQLKDAPYPVTRIDAATPVTQHDRCPEVMAKRGSAKNGGQSALYCSNYLAWNHFFYNTTADYALIMEDDIILQEGFWDRVQGLLDSTCDNDWEYLTVDSFTTSKSKKMRGIGLNRKCGEEQLNDIKTRGTHFQILRRSAIPRMIEHAHEHGPAILDHWENAFPISSIKVSQWTPNICMQSSHEKHTQAHAEGCSTFKTTISFQKESQKDICAT